MNNTNLTGQLPLEFIPEPYLGKEDFMVAACNHEAFALVVFCHLRLRAGRLRKNTLGNHVCP